MLIIKMLSKIHPKVKTNHTCNICIWPNREEKKVALEIVVQNINKLSIIQKMQKCFQVTALVGILGRK